MPAGTPISPHPPVVIPAKAGTHDAASSTPSIVILGLDPRTHLTAKRELMNGSLLPQG